MLKHIEVQNMFYLFILLILLGGCGPSPAKNNYQQTPRETIVLWYQAWDTSDRELLERISYSSLGEIHFNEYKLDRFEVVQEDTLQEDFDRNQHLGGMVGDVVIETVEYFPRETNYPPMRKYFLLRKRDSNEWRVVEYSTVYNQNYPAPPEE
jgi:hypothetical protein